MRCHRDQLGRPACARRGVTLFEIVLALGLLVAVSSMTYWFYAVSLKTSREGTDTAQKLRLQRVTLDRNRAELRQASLIKADNRVGVRGEPERIWLSTYRVPSRKQSEDRSDREQPPPGEYDLAKVEYKIVRHPEVLHEDGYEYPLGLARVEVLIPRPEPVRAPDEEEGRDGEGADGSDEAGGDEESASLLDKQLFGDDEQDGDASLGPDIQWDELYAPEIRYLRFCYYDGFKWWDTWDVAGENPLPQLVMVTLGFDPHPPFEDQLGLDEINDEFCTCLNEDPIECEPLAEDQLSTVVRVLQADPLFRSRVSRETQALMQGLVEGEEE